jgi:hypothetical protein
MHFCSRRRHRQKKRGGGEKMKVTFYCHSKAAALCKWKFQRVQRKENFSISLSQRDPRDVKQKKSLPSFSVTHSTVWFCSSDYSPTTVSSILSSSRAMATITSTSCREPRQLITHVLSLLHDVANSLLLPPLSLPPVVLSMVLALWYCWG